MSKHQQYNGFQLIMGDNDQPKEILIEGIISSWSKTNSRDFRKAFNLLAEGGRDVHVRIGFSQGGDMFEGNVMATMMREAPNKVITYIEGAAASMAAVLFVAGDVRKISKLGMLMTHPPIGYASGSADQIRSYAKTMDTLQKNVITLFREQTGKDESVVANWFKKGEDVWHDAQECIEAGIATEIVQSATLPGPIKDIMERDPGLVFEMFHQTQTQTNTKNEDMKDLKLFMATTAVLLGLSKSADQDEIEAKIQSVVAERDQFKTKLEGVENKLKLEQQSEAKALTDKLVELGKLPEHLAEMQLKAFEADHDATKQAVMAMLSGSDTASQAPKGASTQLSSKVEEFLNSLTGQKIEKPGKKPEDYTEKELEDLSRNNPELYNKILDQIISG